MSQKNVKVYPIDTGETFPLDRTHPKITQVAEFFCNLFLSVAIYAFVVSALFFTVTSQLEGVAVKNNVNRVVEEMLDPVINLLSDNNKEIIQDAMKGLVAPDMSSTDAQVSNSNKNLIKNVMFVMSGLLAFSLFIVSCIWTGMYLKHRKNEKSPPPFNIKLMLVQQGIIVGFVALIQILFLGVIGTSFRSVDANDLRKSVSDSVVTFLKS